MPLNVQVSRHVRAPITVPLFLICYIYLVYFWCTIVRKKDKPVEFLFINIKVPSLSFVLNLASIYVIDI